MAAPQPLKDLVTYLLEKEANTLKSLKQVISLNKKNVWENKLVHNKNVQFF